MIDVPEYSVKVLSPFVLGTKEFTVGEVTSVPPEYFEPLLTAGCIEAHEVPELTEVVIINPPANEVPTGVEQNGNQENPTSLG